MQFGAYIKGLPMAFRFSTIFSVIAFSCGLFFTNCSGMMQPISDHDFAINQINAQGAYLCTQFSETSKIILEVKLGKEYITKFKNVCFRSFINFVNERKTFLENNEINELTETFCRQLTMLGLLQYSRP